MQSALTAYNNAEKNVKRDAAVSGTGPARLGRAALGDDGGTGVDGPEAVVAGPNPDLYFNRGMVHRYMEVRHAAILYPIQDANPGRFQRAEAGDNDPRKVLLLQLSPDLAVAVSVVGFVG